MATLAQVLLDVLPPLAKDNDGDRCVVHSEIFGKLLLTNAVGILCANSTDIIGGQLGLRVHFSWLRSLPVATLVHHILMIVSVCTRPKVIGVYASAIIAFVANVQPFGYCSLVEFVAEAMRPVANAIYVETPIATNIQNCKTPAVIRAALINSGPEFCDLVPAFWRRFVSDDVACGLALDMPFRSISLFCNRSLLSATTVAIAVGDFLRGIIAHVDKLLSAFGQARDTREVSPGVFVGYYSCNYTTGGA